MNRAVHDVLAAWRQAERLRETLPEGSPARTRALWEAMCLRAAYRRMTDPERSTSVVSRRSAVIGRVVANARAYVRDIERGANVVDFTGRGASDSRPRDKAALG